jgi:hypothetical protein
MWRGPWRKCGYGIWIRILRCRIFDLGRGRFDGQEVGGGWVEDEDDDEDGGVYERIHDSIDQVGKS